MGRVTLGSSVTCLSCLGGMRTSQWSRYWRSCWWLWSPQNEISQFIDNIIDILPSLFIGMNNCLFRARYEHLHYLLLGHGLPCFWPSRPMPGQPRFSGGQHYTHQRGPAHWGITGGATHTQTCRHREEPRRALQCISGSQAMCMHIDFLQSVNTLSSLDMGRTKLLYHNII